MALRRIISAVQTRRRREQIYSTADYWDSKVEDFSGTSVSMWPNDNLNAHYHQEQSALFDRYLPEVDGAHVLDIGCGTGRVARHFASRGATVLGFDFAAKAIRVARRHTTGANPTYRVQSLFDLDDHRVYDAAVTWGTVTIACRNREEVRDALTRIRAALKPTGRLLLIEPIHAGFLHRVLRMTVPEFCAVAEETGLEILDVEHLHFWPVRLALAYLPWPRLITTPVYHLGVLAMRLLRNRALGDYQAIHARPRW